jgi:hypothetical protein
LIQAASGIGECSELTGQEGFSIVRAILACMSTRRQIHIGENCFGQKLAIVSPAAIASFGRKIPSSLSTLRPSGRKIPVYLLYEKLNSSGGKIPVHLARIALYGGKIPVRQACV